MPEPVLAALRNGSILLESRLEAFRPFVVEVVRSRRRVSNKRIEVFLAAGYTREHALEVVFAVTMKTVEQFTNMAEIPMDPQFLPQAWSDTQYQSASTKGPTRN